MDRAQYYDRLVKNVVIGGGLAAFIVSSIIAFFMI